MARRAFAITKSDASPLAVPCKKIWVGGAGTLTVDTKGGDTSVLISGIPAGTMIELDIVKVWTTGSTATLLVGFN